MERFDLDAHVVPACWWRHNHLVEALGALRDYERACYAPASPATAAVEFHRGLRDVQALLRSRVADLRCEGGHDPSHDKVRQLPTEGWELWLAREAGHRQGETAPAGWPGDMTRQGIATTAPYKREAHERATDTKEEKVMSTWVEAQPPEVVAAAIEELRRTEPEAWALFHGDRDPEHALWAHLATGFTDNLHLAIAVGVVDDLSGPVGRAAEKAGLSPYEAARLLAARHEHPAGRAAPGPCP